jgi:hypothetical protein
MMGGSPSTADAASSAGRTPSTDVMQSAMGAPGGTTALPEMAPAGRGIASVAPLLQKYSPLIDAAPPPPPPPPPVKRAAPPKAPEPPPSPQTSAPNPMSALAKYHDFVHRLAALAEPSSDGSEVLQIQELAREFGRDS